jgi:hypothetical protein
LNQVAELQRFAVKLFARPEGIPALPDVIPVFHRWIRDGAIDGLLVDVADYGHLPGGPGVVLVGHEADYAMDAMEGPLGLLHTRKQPLPGEFPDRVRAVFRAALAACARLEEDFAGRLSFRAGEALFLSNDRLLAPNDDASFQALRPGLEAAARALYGTAEVAREAGDPRRRLAVRLRSGSDADARTLLARIGA